MSILDEFIKSKDAGWSLTPAEYGAAMVAIRKHSDVYLVVDRNGQYLVNKDKVTTVRVRKDRVPSPDQELLEELGLIESDED